MNKNMGMIDRVIRVILAIALVVLYVTGIIGGTTAIILLVVGAILIATGSMGLCPLYLPFGIKTKTKE